MGRGGGSMARVQSIGDSVTPIPIPIPIPMPNALTPRKDLPAITEGDDIDIPVSFSKPNGSAIDISGWTLSFSVTGYHDSAPTVQKTVTVTNGGGGTAGFHLDPEDTAGLEGAKRYDIQVERDNGVIQTVLLGEVSFIGGVTDTPGSGTGTAGSFTTNGIGVTMAGGEISVAVTVSGTFDSGDAIAAIDGATITPQQIGTRQNPVPETHVQNAHAKTTDTDEVLLNQYPSADAAPAGSGPGIIGITNDGHILVEDGQ